MHTDEQMMNFSAQLNENSQYLQTVMGASSDFVVRNLTLPGSLQMAIFYLDGMVDKQALQESIIQCLHERTPLLVNEISIQSIKTNVLNAPEVLSTSSIAEALDLMLSGAVLLVMDGAGESIVVPMQGWEERSISESKTQSVVRGPQDSFTETLRTNTTLVRRRVKDTRVRVTATKVGGLTKTDIAFMYIEGLANHELVNTLQIRLNEANSENILEGEYLEEILLEEKQLTLFPVIYNTDRPDAIASGILEGKIAIFIDGTPFVLLAPALFVDFFKSVEDKYQSVIFSNLIRLLRYFALSICILAPSVYITLTTFHQDMLPSQLLLSLAAQREGVPFPAFFEAILMEITFEILREAGIRMPRTVGQAVSIVGTIVIGQAAVEATIVSAVMVIVVAITAISSFVIPSYSMSIPVRIVRFGFMILAASFGMYGLTIGIILLLIHLCHLNSFGVPYMSPLAPFDKTEQSDGILRFPFRNRK
ncbi:spore germination protein [Paenibacillus sp. Soil724D2]|uniref:spore germination protein n=1 Tax=Paenibacillus sp. (strain Soil724D2) TaxID=1736392 RepID=UPI00071242C2|nr:spore germination protein [Paenibacillus sp. Soil724D2]KRE32958.1 spore gernimation protein [Paenibacillus sp. Soil724D2]